MAQKGAAHRFKEHQSKAKNGSKLPIHKAIRKHGENIIVDTVVLAEIGYCYEVERSLRPLPSTGYNCDAGGNCNRLGAKLSEDTKFKMSASAKASGRKPSQEALDNSAKTNSKNVAWLCRFSNKEVWKLAGDIYDYLQDNPTHGTRRTSGIFGTTPDQLTQMFKKIKAGWNPIMDTEWLIFSSKLSPDTSGDKSIETGTSPQTI